MEKTMTRYYRILDKMKAKHNFTYQDLLDVCNGKYSEAERFIADVLACGRCEKTINGYRINQ